MAGGDPKVAVIGRTSTASVHTLVAYHDAHRFALQHQKPEWKTLNYHLRAAERIAY